jgi:hypothetical protein
VVSGGVCALDDGCEMGRDLGGWMWEEQDENGKEKETIYNALLMVYATMPLFYLFCTHPLNYLCQLSGFWSLFCTSLLYSQCLQNLSDTPTIGFLSRIGLFIRLIICSLPLELALDLLSKLLGTC